MGFSAVQFPSRSRSRPQEAVIRMGDVQVTAAEANLNFDMLAFHNNFVRSVSDHNTQARPPPLIPS